MVWSTLVGNAMAILRVSRVYLSPHPFRSSNFVFSEMKAIDVSYSVVGVELVATS